MPPSLPTVTLVDHLPALAALAGPARYSFALRVARLADDTDLTLPVNVLVGRRPAPRLTMVAGVHGDEYDGVTAMLDLWLALDPADLDGSVAMVPVANPPAYRAMRRRSPADEIDMNRIFPGDPTGSLTHRLAARISAEVVPGSALLLSMHGWGATGLTAPYVEYPAGLPVTPASQAAAHAFGLPYVEAIDWHPGLLAAATARGGIPAIEPEIGGQAVARPDGGALYQQGTRNLLRHLGILSGTADRVTPALELTGRDDADVIAPVGGVFRALLAPGTPVAAGAPIARITDWRGADLAVLTAPRAGVVLSMRSRAVVEPGDSVALLFAVA
jgi:predicted deacylase